MLTSERPKATLPPPPVQLQTVGFISTNCTVKCRRKFHFHYRVGDQACLHHRRLEERVEVYLGDFRDCLWRINLWNHEFCDIIFFLVRFAFVLRISGTSRTPDMDLR
jgi:hypothetical protein